MPQSVKNHSHDGVKRHVERQYHFISGLPRSGSSLLSGILNQNPRFRAGMSGPLAGMVSTLLGEMSDRNEFSVFIEDEQRQHVLRGLFENYYANQSAAVIFDTSRAWCAHLSTLAQLFPNSRVIACVRHVPWIIDSIERIVQRNAFRPSSIFNYNPNGSVYTRANSITGAEGLLGYAFDALKEAFYGEYADRLLLIQYETLTSDPVTALAAIYGFLGETPFTHDVEHVDFDAHEFDQRAGTPGLHTVRPKVAAIERTTLLPPDLFRRFENDTFWRDPSLNLRSVRIV